MSLRPAFCACLWTILFAAHYCLAQKSAPSSSPGRKEPSLDAEAQRLVGDILAQVPAKETGFEGLLKIRDANGRRTEMRLTYSVAPDEAGWRGTYETSSTPWRGAERLTILHRDRQPNLYFHSAAGGPGEAPKPAVKLSGEEAAIPFGGSDYWLCDLGMEFLHWPEQRVVRDAKIKMRLGRPCHVLESINPTPSASQYRRVVAWLDTESGAPIYAEAFDARGERIKTFSLHGLSKVGGQWHPKDLEMLNEKTDSKTQIEFAVEQR